MPPPRMRTSTELAAVIPTLNAAAGLPRTLAALRGQVAEIIVADGGKLFLYDKDLNQVTVKTLAGAIPASPASILFGSDAFEKEFDVTDAGSRDRLEWVVARPRAKDSPFERIEIGFRDGLPAAMKLTDSFGQVSLLRFAKVERDPKVDAAQFRFTPPHGADVLEDK